MNGATSFELQAAQGLARAEAPLLPAGLYVAAAAGHQIVAKDHETRDVQVLLAAVRVPRHASDVLVILSTPEGAQTGGAADLFRRIVASINIVDWGLFG